MHSRFICIILVVASWKFAATSPNFATFAAHDKQQGKAQISQSSQNSSSDSNPEYELKVHEEKQPDEECKRSIGPGSWPPKCEHKCKGCQPCIPVQVPETGGKNQHLVVEYANYEPESWVCQCGSSFFVP